MAAITKPTNFVDNTIPTAAQFNSDFDTIYSEFNGSIDNANIKAGAGILESKIAFSGTGHGHSGGTDGKSVQINRNFGFFIQDNLSIANDLSWNPISPQAVTAVKLWAYLKTAPTGTGATIQVYNVTQAKIVATLAISATSQTGSTTSMTNAAIAAGDVLRIDCTVIGSTIAGANLSAGLECSQP